MEHAEDIGDNRRTHGDGEKHHPDTAEEAERGAAGGPDCSCFSSCREGHGDLLRIGPQAKIVGRVIINKAYKQRAEIRRFAEPQGTGLMCGARSCWGRGVAPNHPLQQTAGACSVSGTHSSPSPRGC